MRIRNKTTKYEDILHCIESNVNFIAGLVYINQKSLSKNDIENIKKSLTYVEIEFNTDEEVTHYGFYEYESYLIIPRYFESVYFTLNIDIETEFICPPTIIDIENKFPPRNEAQKTLVDTYLNNNIPAIIKAPPGFGKTYIAVKIISELKYKSLIIVDNIKLANQWVSDIKEFTNLIDEDIRIISGSDEVTDKNLDNHIIIMLIQTASSITKKQLLPDNKYFITFAKANIGMIVLDEIHKSFGSKEFSKAALLFVSPRLLGLSATPRKSSEKGTNILMSYFDNNLMLPTYEKKSKIHAQIFHFNSGIPTKTLKWIQFGGRWNNVNYRKTLLKSPAYISSVLFISQHMKDLGKNIIFIAHEVNHLNTIIESLVESGWNKDDIGLAIAGSTPEQLDKQYVFSTYKMMTAGLSLNSMDTLFYLTPPGATSTAIEQSSGRIDRDHNDSETKKLVIDLVDTTHRKISSRILPRVREYLRLNIIVERLFTINIIDNKVTGVNLEDKDQLINTVKNKYQLF